MDNKYNTISWWSAAIVLFIITAVVFIVNGNTWATQILAACLGAIITVIVTRLLLSKQSEIEQKQKAREEEAKKDFERYSAKLKVYSSFVSKMYNILRDNEVTKDELLDLRTQILGKVSFYAYGDILAGIKKELDSKKVGDFRDNVENIQRCFANIASLLQKDLRGNGWNADSSGAIELWSTFDGLLDKFNEKTVDDAPLDSINVIPEKQPLESINENDVASRCFNSTFWHFNMYGTEQLEAFRNGIYELNLIEYGEDWRTGLIKQVKNNDLIFLFRAGGPGYMGVYRAKGWKIFKFNKEDGSTTERLNLFGEPEQEINNPSDEEINKSDIYESKEDGATLCSSLIVEPLAYARTGIGNPGGVYRRTISRYDRNYGLKQLACFKAIMNDSNTFNVSVSEDGKIHEMGCNKELLGQILEVGNIKPAQRDKNGHWTWE